MNCNKYEYTASLNIIHLSPDRLSCKNDLPSGKVNVRLASGVYYTVRKILIEWTNVFIIKSVNFKFLNIRSSLREVPCKKGALKTFAKFIEKLSWCSLLNAMYTNAMAIFLVLEKTGSLILTGWMVTNMTIEQAWI